MKTLNVKNVKNAPKAGAAPAATALLAENLTNDETRVITDAMMAVGDAYAQGDLYFVRIAGLPKSAKPRANRQLADGNTQGSRHVCTSGEVFDADPAELAGMVRSAAGVAVDARYVGPIVRTVGGTAYVGHPEHGDHDYRGDDMTMACVFQRALDSEEREQRVAD